MAIEIIKNGTIHPNDTFKTHCKRCETIFRFKRNDGCGLLTRWWIKCPACGKPIPQRRWITETIYYT